MQKMQKIMEDTIESLLCKMQTIPAANYAFKDFETLLTIDPWKDFIHSKGYAEKFGQKLKNGEVAISGDFLYRAVTFIHQMDSEGNDLDDEENKEIVLLNREQYLSRAFIASCSICSDVEIFKEIFDLYEKVKCQVDKFKGKNDNDIVRRETILLRCLNSSVNQLQKSQILLKKIKVEFKENDIYQEGLLREEISSCSSMPSLEYVKGEEEEEYEDEREEDGEYEDEEEGEEEEDGEYEDEEDGEEDGEYEDEEEEDGKYEEEEDGEYEDEENVEEEEDGKYEEEEDGEYEDEENVEEEEDGKYEEEEDGEYEDEENVEEEESQQEEEFKQHTMGTFPGFQEVILEKICSAIREIGNDKGGCKLGREQCVEQCVEQCQEQCVYKCQEESQEESQEECQEECQEESQEECQEESQEECQEESQEECQEDWRKGQWCQDAQSASRRLRFVQAQCYKELCEEECKKEEQYDEEEEEEECKKEECQETSRYPLDEYENEETLIDRPRSAPAMITVGQSPHIPVISSCYQETESSSCEFTDPWKDSDFLPPPAILTEEPTEFRSFFTLPPPPPPPPPPPSPPSPPSPPLSENIPPPLPLRPVSPSSIPLPTEDELPDFPSFEDVPYESVPKEDNPSDSCKSQ